MDNLQINRLRDCIQCFDLKRLFIEELGWSHPKSAKPHALSLPDGTWQATPLAEMSGVLVFRVAGAAGLPDSKTRDAIHKLLSEIAHENLLVFLDRAENPSQSLWLWVKRDGAKRYPREHLYVKGQPGDLFVSKISGIVVDINELDEQGNFPLAQLVDRMKSALDVERVTKKFFREYDSQRLVFVELIQGIPGERERRWYASVLLNRLMFVWFLQKKHFLDGGNDNYLGDKLTQTRQQGSNRYYEHFLKPLFFQGFAKPKNDRTPEARALLGEIKYLNGGLFLPHRIEQDYPGIQVPDRAFENLFALFGRYSWNLDDTPGGKDDEINPDVLGYIFEKYINQKAFGAYYTRPEITEYLCGHTLYALILEKINQPAVPELNLPARQFDSVPELLVKLDAELCRELLFKVLPKLSLLDPACGSGAFLVAAMKTLINLYSAIVGRIKFLNEPALSQWLKRTEADHPNIHYFIKKTIITDNLFGVDIMEEATEIAKLRLFLALVASAQTVDQLEPLPNIDFNIMAGNSLVGLTHVSAEDYEKNQTADLFRPTYRQILEEKNRLIDQYRRGAEVYGEDLRVLRNYIDEHKKETQKRLNDLLLAEFAKAGVKFEQATWDAVKGKAGKPVKRPLKIEDIEALHPFHWGYEFDEILNQRGGFDAIITNPPWEILKPQAKEFFAEHSDLVSKNKMTIKDFEKEQDKLLQDPEIRAAWLEYQSRFPHVSAWFRASSQYPRQTAVVNGKKTGSDINLYKLFVEQGYNLLRADGQCGIVIPSGIYTDLGAKGLRDLLFGQTRVTGLFCFENKKEIFEGVHRSFKFVVLTFEKGGETARFPAAFMRHEVAELAHFPQIGAQWLAVELIRRLSPDSHSVMEFKSELDVQIAEKMLKFPLLGEKIKGEWNLRLSNEFHMTNDSKLFKAELGEGRLPLYEGKMIHQFESALTMPRYWIKEEDGRLAILGRNGEDKGQKLPYQTYRFAHRSIARNTDTRTMIGSILPAGCFFGHSMNAAIEPVGSREQVALTALFNSFVFDYFLRQMVTANLTMFFIYQCPVPRLAATDPRFTPIIARAARLICTTPEFDALAKEVGLESHRATDPTERARLRAELDGLVAHLYGLTESEFAHVLTTFPLVPEPVKIAAQNAYRDVERGLIQ
ncbi:MAG: hypothetical protein PHE55_03975 [Methylococcaceae bacterium]|nr:hypothetical protein [Methylococcaceae bacterium]